MTTEPVPAAPKPAKRFDPKKVILWLVIAGVVCSVFGFFYWLHTQKFIFSDKAEISAPLIQLSPNAPGVLMSVNVNEGDDLSLGQAVARVGDEIIHTQVSGHAVVVKKDIGTVYNPGQPVVTMIQPEELRVIAKIQEDKGLSSIRVGQNVQFTVDAFGGKTFNGTVENVSPTKNAGDVVFNISDKREEQEFDIKINFDHQAYASLQNGMSARVWIIK